MPTAPPAGAAPRADLPPPPIEASSWRDPVESSRDLISSLERARADTDGTGGRAEISPIGPDFAMTFKKTTQAVQRCKN